MAESVANILLRITGESSEARRELELVAKQVQQFDQEEGTATADVDADPAERKLRDLVAEMARVAREKVTAKVDADTSDATAGLRAVSVAADALDAETVDVDVAVDADVEPARRTLRDFYREAAATLARNLHVGVEADTAAADAGLRAVEARADLLDAKRVDVEVDVDVDRADRGLSGFLSKLGGLFRQAGKVNTALGELSQAGFGAVTGGAGQASGAMDNFSGSVGTGGIAARVAGVAAAALAAILGPILVAAIGSAVVAIAALAASLTLALGALGALALGFGALLAPAILLGVAAVERFKRTAGIAGTAANELKVAFQGFMGVFRKAVAPAAGAVFEGLAGALRILTPMVKQLGPVFERFGRAVGAALVRLATEFARPVWVEFFRRLIGMASKVVPALTGLFIGLLRVLRNVVLVVLPFLAPLLQKAAGAMKSLAKNGASVEGIWGFFGDALPHLKAWLRLLGAIGDVFLGFVKAAAPAGLELVGWLTDGARAIADWVRSAQGQGVIKKFFADTLPLVKETVEFFGRLAVLAVTAFQAIAPALQGVMSQMNFWIGFIQRAVTAWNTLSASLRSILFPLNGLAAVFGYLSTAVGTVIPAVSGLASAIVGGLKGAVPGVAGAISSVVGTIVGGVRGAVGGALNAAKAVGGGIANGIRSVAETVAGAARSIVERVVAVVRGFVGGALAAGRAVFNAVRNGIASAAGVVREAARSILSAVVSVVRGFVGGAQAAGRAVFSAVRNGIASAGGAVRDAARSILSAVVAAVRSFVGAAQAAGRAVFNAVRGGIASVAGAVRDAARSAVTGAIGAVLSLASSFFNAGRALVMALANGIRSAAGEAINALRDVANTLRGLLPGSEPTDGSSPLRNLGAAGAAIVANIAAGIRQGAPALLSTFTGALRAVEGALKELVGNAAGHAQALRTELVEIGRRMRISIGDLNAYRTALGEIAESLREVRERALLAFALQQLDNSPEAQELRGLQAEDTRIAAETEMNAALKQLADARASGNVQAETEALAAIAAINRSRRIAELGAALQAKRDEIQKKADLNQLGQEGEFQQYNQTLARQLNALKRQLAQGKISYRAFVGRVNVILGRVGEGLRLDLKHEKAFENARDEFAMGGKGMIGALIHGMRSRFDEAKGVLREFIADMRKLLPGSEPKDPSSPLRRLGDSGEAIIGNLVAGMARAGPALAAQLAGAVSGISVQATGGFSMPGAMAPTDSRLLEAMRSQPQPQAAGPVVHVTVPTVVPADSASLAAILDTVTDAMSRAGYREAKVQVVR